MFPLQVWARATVTEGCAATHKCPLRLAIGLAMISLSSLSVAELCTLHAQDLLCDMIR